MMRKKDAFAPPLHLVLVVFILCLLISVLGYFFYEYQQRQIRTAKEHELFAIADLKADEIRRWSKERLADAQIIAGNPLVVSGLSAFIREPENDALKEKLLCWMNSVRDSYGYYGVLLLDASGALRLDAGGGAKRLCPFEEALATRALREKEILFSDFFRSEAEGGKVLLALCVPLLEKDGRAPFALMMLTIDPARFLYPLIQIWPAPSPSSETLLVRRDGAEVVYLNELRHRKNTPLFLRAPAESRELLAAKAARG